MRDTIVRLESIQIENFKNVGFGKLDFSTSKKGNSASILGLYGQNGSGKTAMIDALDLLRILLSGKSVPARFADYINVGNESATLRFGFKITSEQNKCDCSAIYKVELRREVASTEQNMEHPAVEERTKAVITEELLSASIKFKDENSIMTRIIDTSTPENVAFLPETKYKAIAGGSKDTLTSLLVAKQVARTTSRSFVFSRELLDVMRQNCKKSSYSFLLESLVYFGNVQLFVIKASSSGLVSINALPLSFSYAENNTMSYGSLLINLDKPTSIPKDALDVVHKVTDCMNIVLQQLIPGLTICVKDLGNEVLQSGTVGYRVQLMSSKNKVEIPLRYESDGIKKLVSVLQLLIAVYNNPSVTVAIDELDSGIFEYLLGEVLRIISEKGEGQLVFTSHNLRPLEILDKCFIAFTTTNPQNRYIRLTNVKTTNNLRSFYYRDIVLGEQSESVYEPTNNSEIALAFREAGNLNVS